MSLADRADSTALKMLRKYGEELTFSKSTGSAFDPATGAVTGGSNNTYTGNGLTSAYNKMEADGTSIYATDLKLLLSTETAPRQGDTVTIESIVYRVMSVQPIRVEGETVAYRCQLRD